MSEFLSQLFTDLTTFDSIIVLGFLLGAFLIGLFSGRASISGRLRRLQVEYEKQKEELKTIDII